MAALYNEIDPIAAHVLRALISEGVIAPGVVDTRSITELTPDDVKGFTQCHFFAGGGLWSVAARLAGWPDDRPLWTGSCPCQPFSAAGKGLGTDDPRHLWPDFFRLIRGARAAGFGPPVIMGEQVSQKAGYHWIDGVRADLASEGYACRARDIPALAVDAPHERNRLYWIAVEHATGERRGERRPEHEFRGRWPTSASANASGITQGDAFGPRLEGQSGHGDGGGGRQGPAGSIAPADGGGLDVADRDGGRRSGWQEDAERIAFKRDAFERPAFRNGSFWSDAEWLACHDGKARRTKPGLRLLVDGLPGRVGLWRIAGNAIVTPLAAEVIGAFLDAERAAA